MVRHVVLFKLSSSVQSSAAETLFSAIRALQAKIPGIVAVSCGRDQSPEGLQRGNTHGFTVDFVNSGARDAYLPHPAHQEVGSLIVANAEGGLSGITVLDWDM